MYPPLNMKRFAPQKFPTREQLRRRFINKLGYRHEIFDPLVAMLSEEAEKVILELWAKRQPVSEKIKKEPVVRLRKLENRTSSYYCLNCKTKKINTVHKYCPCCGYKIIWYKVAGLKEFNQQIKKTA